MKGEKKLKMRVPATEDCQWREDSSCKRQDKPITETKSLPGKITMGFDCGNYMSFVGGSLKSVRMKGSDLNPEL